MGSMRGTKNFAKLQEGVLNADKIGLNGNSEFHLISRDQPILNRNEASLPLYLFD